MTRPNLPARRLLVVAAILMLAAWVWRSELFVVQAPDEPARPLALREVAMRRPVGFDVELPGIPNGARLAAGREVLIVQYWAPWERHGLAQAAGLDSLRKLPELRGLRPVLVTFDPFPSVARYVGRMRLGLEVLLDHHRTLAAVLPCPQLPTAYVVDTQGRIAAEIVGEVDWLAPGTRRALLELLAEREPVGVAPV